MSNSTIKTNKNIKSKNNSRNNSINLSHDQEEKDENNLRRESKGSIASRNQKTSLNKNVAKNELNIVNLIYYYNLLELLKTDVAKIMLENPQSLEIFPSLFKYENFNYNSTIDQIVIITDIFDKLEVSLFNLIFTFNNLDWSYFLADVNKENLTEVSNINTLMLLSMCDIIDSYLQNTFFSVNFFDVNFLKFALLFILISLFFKLAIAPFHVWAPDVYENSPSASTFFFSVVPKLALFVLLFRIF